MRIPIATSMSLLLGLQPVAWFGPLPGSRPPAAAAVAAAADDLTAAVTARLGAGGVPAASAPPGPGRSAADSTASPAAVAPQVSVGRRAGQWAFGTAVRPAPAVAGAYPEGWLYLARRVDRRWQVALHGEPEFARLSALVPFLAAEERQLLGTRPEESGGRPEKFDTGDAGTAAGPAPADAVAGGQAGADRRTGMRLPFTIGQRWRYTGGPHPMSGSVRSSIDLAGGDGRVLAVRGGVAYTMCRSGRGWVRVVHDRGYATDYYHLAGNIRVSGRRISEGDFLGRIGNDVSCGGASTGPHVHFSLLRNGAYIPIDGYVFGKWVIRNSPGQYDGTAWHGSYRARVDTNLHNYGGLNFNQGIVDSNGGRSVNRRAGPGVGYRLLGTVRDGATVTVLCSRRGTTHAGRYGYRSNLWNRLADGTWVSDVYLWTGTGGPVRGYC